MAEAAEEPESSQGAVAVGAAEELAGAAEEVAGAAEEVAGAAEEGAADEAGLSPDSIVHGTSSVASEVNADEAAGAEGRAEVGSADVGVAVSVSYVALSVPLIPPWTPSFVMRPPNVLCVVHWRSVPVLSVRGMA